MSAPLRRLRRAPVQRAHRVLYCLLLLVVAPWRSAQAQVPTPAPAPLLLEAEIDARPRIGAPRIARIWNHGHVSAPYAVFNDEHWRVGTHITKRWMAANFPYISHVLIANFLLGNTATRPPWTTASGLRVEEIWTRAGGFNALWDRYLGNAISSGVLPIVSLTGTPRDMVQGPILDWPYAFFHHVVEPPTGASLAEWGDLIETLYRRYEEMGYEPGRWKWATWMEPDLLGRFVGTQADYVNLALTARAALERAAGESPAPELRFGNFLSPTPTSYPYVGMPGDIQSSAAQYLLQTNLPSSLGGTAMSLFLVEPKDQGLRFLEGSLRRMREICVQAGVPRYPIHVDELGILYYWHPVTGLPGGGTNWIQSLRNEPAMNSASWLAMMLHTFLDEGVASCAPFFINYYWRGFQGDASSNTNHWIKLAAYNAIDLYEELVGMERVPFALRHERREPSRRNGVEPIGRVSGVVGRDDHHVSALLYSHGGVEATEEVTVDLRFSGLLGYTPYLAEIYRIDRNRGSAFDRMLRKWIERAQRHPTPFRFPNGIWSWDLSADRRFDFYVQEPLNYLVTGWCMPLGEYAPTAGAQQFFAAGLDTIITGEEFPTYQALDDYYLSDSTIVATDASGGGTGLAVTLPMHAVALVRLSEISEHPDTGTLHLSFEKNLESAEGILPSAARSISYDRGVETPLAWKSGHRHPGIDWTAHERTVRNPNGIYPPANRMLASVGNGTEAYRGLRCATVDGALPRLEYAEHPLNPVRGSIDVWFKPEGVPGISAAMDDVTGGSWRPVDRVLLHCAETPGVDEFLIHVVGEYEVAVRWILDGVTVVDLDIPIVSIGPWNETWQRLTVQWSFDVGGTREFRLQAVANGRTSFATRRLHRNTHVTGPSPLAAPLHIGRHAYDASFEPWNGVIDELRIAAVSDAYYP